MVCDSNSPETYHPKRAKNALNERSESDVHPMKTREYMIWHENRELHGEKFWDARFSNLCNTDPSSASFIDTSSLLTPARSNFEHSPPCLVFLAKAECS